MIQKLIKILKDRRVLLLSGLANQVYGIVTRDIGIATIGVILCMTYVVLDAIDKK